MKLRQHYIQILTYTSKCFDASNPLMNIQNFNLHFHHHHHHFQHPEFQSAPSRIPHTPGKSLGNLNNQVPPGWSFGFQMEDYQMAIGPSHPPSTHQHLHPSLLTLGLL